MKKIYFRYILPIKVVFIIGLIVFFLLPKNTHQRDQVKPEKRKIGYQSVLIDLDQSQRDKERQLKRITLDNGIDVLLVSDSKAMQSSAAMSVGVGSLEDPKEHQGLAHYTEHMLFMGSKKYPKVDDYHHFIDAHGGSSNAYTSLEETNYFFIVNHEAYEGALDRFAQFFIEPLFDKEFLARELKAVNSEHQKNLQNKAWRDARLIKLMSKKEHPHGTYNSGDANTLKNVTQDVMLEFYKKNYSANRMKLVLKSDQSIEKLEKLAKEMFLAVPNNNVSQLKYKEGVFDFSKAPFIKEKPITNRKELVLFFQTPTFFNYLKTKPHYFVSSLIGHEGEGSLLSLLKEEDLVTGLYASLESYSYLGLFKITFNLTEKGTKNIKDIIKHTFSYVKLLKQEGLKKYYFDEIKALGEMYYVFRTPSKGMGDVEDYAYWMKYIKQANLDKDLYLYDQYSSKAFEDIFSYITPNNMLALLVLPETKATQIEEHYGIEYDVSYFTQEDLTSFKMQPINEKFKYPVKNIFMPDDLAIYKDDAHKAPYKIYDNDKAEFWFMQDKALGIPKAKVGMTLYSDVVNASPLNKVMSILYIKALHLSMIEWAYPMNEAGLSYGVSRSNKGIEIAVAGYSDKIPYVLNELIKRLKTITITSEQFESIKEKFKRDIDSWYYSVAYQQARYHLSNVIDKPDISMTQYPPINDVTLDDVKNIMNQIYANIYVKGMAYGNLKAHDLTKVVANIHKELGAGVLPKDKRVEDELIDLGQGSEYYFVPPTKTDNYAWYTVFQFGKRSHELKAYLLLGNAYLQTDFFRDMRSVKQLGYIVANGVDFYKKALGFYFLIQSGKYDPLYIQEQALPWLKEAVKNIKNMPDEQFETYRQAIIKRVEEDFQSINEWYGYMRSAIENEKGDFEFKQKLINALKKATKEGLAQTFQKALDKSNQAMLSVYIVPEGKKVKLPKTGVRINNVSEFKQNKPVYE